MSGLRYTSFYETCDWEGETWRFWLQHDGNRDAITELSLAMADDPDYDEDQYWFGGEILEEDEVDILIEYSHAVYRELDNKIDGRLVVLDDFRIDVLYKGGIRGLFH